MIYITGDTHGAFDIHKINPDEFIPGRSLTEKDYVIICGDFGCIWDGGTNDAFWLKWLASLKWNVLFIDGNHENFDVLNAYPVVDFHDGKAHRIRHNIYHLMRGEVFQLDGKSFFAFGGGYSHDYQCRVEKKSWWQDEMPTQIEVDRAHDNLKKVNYKVDYVLSHDIFKSHPLSKKFEIDMNHYDNKYLNIQNVLESLRKQLNYSCWFNGHYHVDQIYYIEDKPCITLFDKVLFLDELASELKTFSQK